MRQNFCYFRTRERTRESKVQFTPCPIYAVADVNVNVNKIGANIHGRRGVPHQPSSYLENFSKDLRNFQHSPKILMTRRKTQNFSGAIMFVY